MEEVFKELHEDNTIQHKQLALKYDVRPSDISKALANNGIPSTKRLLEAEQEDMLVKEIEMSFAHYKPMTKRQVLTRVVEMFTERTGTSRDKLPSDDWWKEFKKRHPTLKLRKLKQQDLVR
ncbi:hypothetical protein SAMD00019534_085040, partial [Acytostelium subglobosum LB1]|uniref:hypothetical protein n=2 Tax=Acytostelium subglobosum LB1 TaxID=1410327 RepID=UPI000644EA75